LYLCAENSQVQVSSKKGLDIDEHERLSNVTLRHKLNYRNIAIITGLHFTLTVETSTVRITHALKWVWYGP